MYPIPFFLYHPYASFFKFAGFLIYLYSSSSSLNPLSPYRNKLKFLLNDSRFARGVHGHQVIISFMSHVVTADRGALPDSDTDWRHLLLTQQSSSFRGVSLCERTRQRRVSGLDITPLFFLQSRGVGSFWTDWAGFARHKFVVDLRGEKQSHCYML